MEFIKSNEKLVFFSINYSILYVLFIFFSGYYTKVDEIVSYAFFCFLFLSPVVLIQFLIHYNHSKKSIDSLLVGKNNFDIKVNTRVSSFYFSDIEKTKWIGTPNNYRNNIHFLPWDDYYYLQVYLKSGDVIFISSLLGDGIRNEFEGKSKVEMNQRLIPMLGDPDVRGLQS
jgi:hypothetical protein